MRETSRSPASALLLAALAAAALACAWWVLSARPGAGAAATTPGAVAPRGGDARPQRGVAPFPASADPGDSAPSEPAGRSAQSGSLHARLVTTRTARPPGSVVGVLRNEEDEPLAGARVRALFGRLPEDAWMVDEVSLRRARLRYEDVVTDEEGAFAFTETQPGAVRLLALAEDHAPLEVATTLVSGVEQDLGVLVPPLGVTLAGHVVDADGRRVAGARIHQPRLQPDWSDPLATPRGPLLAVSSAKGTFRLPHLAAGPWRFLVESDSHPNALLEGRLEPAGTRVTGHRLQLPAGLTLDGHVVFPNGDRLRAVVGSSAVRVRARLVARDASFETRFSNGEVLADVGAEGAFRLEGLLPGADYELTAFRSTPDFRPHHAGGFASPRAVGPDLPGSLRARPEEGPVRLVLDATAALDFEVRDARTGLEPADWTASLHAMAWNEYTPARSRALTGPPDGALRIVGGRMVCFDLEPGPEPDAAPGTWTWTLRVSAPGYATAELEGIVLHAGERLALGALRLEPLDEVPFHVVDAAGAPVARARVRGTGFDLWDRLAGPVDESTTDRDGRATLRFAVGTKLLVSAAHDDFAPSQQLEFVVEARPPLRTLVLTEGGALRVDVLAPSGAALGGARVTAGWNGPEGAAPRFASTTHSGWTDAAGRAWIPHRAPGRTALTVEFGEERVRTLERDVFVTEGEVTEVVVRVPRASAIAGTVRERARPLPGAELRLVSGHRDLVRSRPAEFLVATTASDAAGAYRFAGIEPGPYTLVVHDPERVSDACVFATVDAEEERIDISLRTSTLVGTVTNGAGRAVPGARVRAVPLEHVWHRGANPHRLEVGLDDDAVEARHVTCDVDGRFRLRGFDSRRRYVLEVRAAGFAPTRDDRVWIADDALVERTFVLVPEARLVVDVPYLPGDPLARVRVLQPVRWYENLVAGWVHVSRDGPRTIGGLRAGTYVVEVADWPEAGALRSREIALEAGGSLTLDVAR